MGLRWQMDKKRGLQTEEKRCSWRIVSSAILGYLMALGLFVALTPLPASADDDEDSRHGHEDNDKGIRAELAALQAQVTSGSGRTDDNGNPTGLGNLIIGYDEDPSTITVPLSPGDRGGSHNLVIGRFNRFTRAAFGGLVAGEVNSINNEGTSVSGGTFNIASGQYTVVLGGQNVIDNNNFSIAPQPPFP